MAENYINLEVMDSKYGEWKQCFTIMQSIDYKTSIVLAASTEKHGGESNHHFVHSFNFWDMEGPTESSKKNVDGFFDDDFDHAGKKFDANAFDLLHLINADSDLAHNATRAIDAYNDQLIAHNSRYAKLIASVYRN